MMDLIFYFSPHFGTTQYADLYWGAANEVLIAEEARKLNSSEQWREFLGSRELHEMACFSPQSLEEGGLLL